MSSTILYRAMFVRVGDNQYIPMIEIGDSNVFESSAGNAKRVRDWQNWRVPGREEFFIHTREQIMAGVENLINDYKNRYVNQPTNEWDNTSERYWTFKEVEKNLGWLSATTIYGKSCAKTTARMIRNFFKRGFDNCFDIVGGRWTILGHIPIVLRHYNEDGRTENTTFDTVGEMVETLTSADGRKSWLEYNYTADTIWRYLKSQY